LYRAAAQVRNQANLAGGIPALTAVIDGSKPAYAGAYLELADALRSAGDMGKAAARYRQAIERGPKDWRTHYGLALALTRSDAMGALRSLNRALELAPREYAIYDAAAAIRAGMGQGAEAIATLRAGVRAVPDSADLRNNLGTALLRAGDLKGAETELREAVRLRPEVASLRMNLASLLARTNRAAEANFEFEAAIRLAPESADAHSAYGAALAAQSRFADARGELEAALRLNPGLANTHNNLGMVLRQLGDEGGARREFEAALRLDRGHAAARRNLDAGRLR
jgi:Flp pilus assembly protein TadD